MQGQKGRPAGPRPQALNFEGASTDLQFWVCRVQEIVGSGQGKLGALIFELRINVFCGHQFSLGLGAGFRVCMGSTCISTYLQCRGFSLNPKPLALDPKQTLNPKS